MKPQKRDDLKSKVFITGLRAFEIAFLPGCGKVVSYLTPLPAPVAEVGEATSSPEGESEEGKGRPAG